jgi:hypothetical protein
LARAERLCSDGRGKVAICAVTHRFQAWIERNQLRETNVTKSQHRRGIEEHASPATGSGSPGGVEQPGNGDIPVGRRGAPATLLRLEFQEASAYSRLDAALARGNPVEIDAAQSYWLRVAETLRRLDAGLELGRWSAEQQVSKRLASDVTLAIADWLRTAFAQFLSSEVRMLMGFKDVGEFKAYAFSRFVSILHLTVRNSLKTNSPIPDWAADKIKESWNVQWIPRLLRPVNLLDRKVPWSLLHLAIMSRIIHIWWREPLLER